MTTPTLNCPFCGSTSFEEGFIDDVSSGRVRWVQGPMRVGLLGNSKRLGRSRRQIVSLRCTNCSRLELFAGDET